MEINALGSTGLNISAMKANSEKAAEKIAEKSPTTATTVAAAEKAADGNRDEFVRSINEEKVTYSNTQVSRLSQDQVNSLKESQINSYKALIEQMFNTQSTKSNFSTEFTKILSSGTTDASSFENDPEWGIDAVATRIMDLAESLAGGDASKLETLRKAVQDGFGAAQKSWGSEKMPSITGKTYDEVMKRFDDWEQKLAAEA